MIGMTARTTDKTKGVRTRAKKRNIESLGHAAAVIRLTARRSIRRRKKAAAVGKPPHTRKGDLRTAIAYVVEKHKDRAIIGPEVTKVGHSALAHEHGGRYKRQRYPKRPFMGPALQKTKNRLPRKWAGSVKS